MSAGDRMIVIVAILAVMLVLLSTIIALIWYFKKQKKESLQLKEQGLLGCGAKGGGTVEDTQYFYEHWRGGKNAPPYFRVTVDCPAAGSFKIERETSFDRFFKRWGICVEMDTGDAEFDDAFLITSDTPGFTQQYLAKPEKRRAIAAIFQEGFNQVQLKGNKLTATWNRLPRKKYFAETTVKEIAARLALLSRNIPEVYQYERMSMQTSAWKIKRFIGFAVPSLLLLAGFVGMMVGFGIYTPLDIGPILADSFKFSIPFFIIYVVLAVQLLKGRSSSHRELMIVFFLSLVGFILAGMGGEVTLNGMLDRSEATVSHALVLDKYYTKNKSSYTYRVVLESWRKGEKTEKISVNYNYYEKLIPGKSELTITTKAGKFGFPWLVGYQ